MLEGMLFIVAFFPIPAMIGERLVKERVTKVRGTLAVMGCSPMAYYIGSAVGDLVLFSVTLMGIYIDMWANGWTGDLYIALPLFMAQLTAFSYVLSFLFSTPRSALSYTPAVVVGLWLLPGFLTILFILLLASYLGNVDLIYCITYGLACGTPFGSLFVIFLDTQTDGSLDEYPKTD